METVERCFQAGWALEKWYLQSLGRILNDLQLNDSQQKKRNVETWQQCFDEGFQPSKHSINQQSLINGPSIQSIGVNGIGRSRGHTRDVWKRVVQVCGVCGHVHNCKHDVWKRVVWGHVHTVMLAWGRKSSYSTNSEKQATNWFKGKPNLNKYYKIFMPLKCLGRSRADKSSLSVLKVWMDGHGRRPGTYFKYVLASSHFLGNFWEILESVQALLRNSKIK